MKTIEIRESFKLGWKKFMERPWYLVGLMALLIMLTVVMASRAMFSALAYIALGGYTAVLLAHVKGSSTSIDDMFDLVDKRWIYFVFASALKTLLILLGFVCLILPGIYIAVRLMFVELLIIDKSMRPVEALRASIAMTKGHFWKLLALVFTMLVVILLGLVLVVVGVLPASIIATFAIMHVYLTLSAQPEQAPIENNS